eukprot:jgi/Picre1/30117/NNA_005486.t1
MGSCFIDRSVGGGRPSVSRTRYGVSVQATQKKPAMRDLSPRDSSKVLTTHETRRELVPMTYKGAPVVATTVKEQKEHNAPMQFQRTMMVAGFDDDGVELSLHRIINILGLKMITVKQKGRSIRGGLC